jgi:recombination protein RecT
MENQNNLTKTNGALQVKEKNITDKVLNQVTFLTQKQNLVLPKNYSVENALKFAFLDLKANNLLETNQDALATALLNMCVQGLNPAKKQCYFINYGGKVGLMRSYHGDRAVAKHSGIVKDIEAYVIYEGDKIDISYDADTNYLVVDHKTEFKNWNNAIVGAYAVAVMPDGTKRYDLMTIERIKKSWEMSSNKNGNKLQNNFSSDACQRTVTRHLVKNLFNQTTDESLLINNVLENEVAIDNETKQDAADFVYNENEVKEHQDAETGEIIPNLKDEVLNGPKLPKEEQEQQESLFDKYLDKEIDL